MAEQRPELVDSKPPTFRVRRVGHGAEADVESELEAAAKDGYSFDQALPQANGDVLLFFTYAGAPAPAAEA